MPETSDHPEPTEPSSEIGSRLNEDKVHLAAQLSDLDRDEVDLAVDDNFADSGQVAAEEGENRTLAAQLREQLDDVERALTKLDDGSYGTCEICEAAIGPDRLEAMPATRFCIEHAG